MNLSDPELPASEVLRRIGPLGLIGTRLQRIFEARGASATSLVFVLVIGFLGWLQVFPNLLLVVVLLGVVVFEFQKRLDQGLPLMQIAALLAVLQWVVGSALSFETDLALGRYSMYVGEEEYFRFALPGTCAMVFGLLATGFSVRQRNLLEAVNRDRFVVVGFVLNGVALASRFLAEKAPGGLAFALHLTTQLSYVGALYFLFSNYRHRLILSLLSLFPLFWQTAESAMFHDLLLWIGLLFCFWYSLRKHTGGAKAGLLVTMGISLFTIQAVKQSYREKVWSGQEGSFAGEVVAFWSDFGEVTSDEVIANVVVRLNQGWIISAVMSNVPVSEPFAEGETIKGAFAAALLPRFLYEDKAKAGGQENFRRFTGLGLEETTSMAVSPLGEAYANFGEGGGILLILGFGFVFSIGYSWCLRWAARYPDFIFWIPLIFYQAIKAETEFATVLNQMTKGAVVAFGLHWLIVRNLVPGMFRGTRVPQMAGNGFLPERAGDAEVAPP